MRATTVVAVIPAQDIARATAFYEEALGFVPTGNGPDGTRMYQAADGSNFMVYPTQFAGTGKHTVAGFMVDDLAETMADLRGKGVTFEEYDLGEGMTTQDGVVEYEGMKTAWITDPEGNTISIGSAPADWATRDWPESGGP